MRHIPRLRRWLFRLIACFLVGCALTLAIASILLFGSAEGVPKLVTIPAPQIAAQIHPDFGNKVVRWIKAPGLQGWETISQDAPRLDQPRFFQSLSYEAGWPWPVLHGRVTRQAPERFQFDPRFGRTRNQIDAVPLIIASDQQVAVWPRIHFGGLTGGGTFVGVLLYVLWLMGDALRFRLQQDVVEARASRNQCLKCGHDLGNGTICTECGEPIPAPRIK